MKINCSCNHADRAYQLDEISKDTSTLGEMKDVAINSLFALFEKSSDIFQIYVLTLEIFVRMYRVSSPEFSIDALAHRSALILDVDVHYGVLSSSSKYILNVIVGRISSCRHS